jgi:RNA polymerase sigma-70 factor (ECF subfamily)
VRMVALRCAIDLQRKEKAPPEDAGFDALLTQRDPELDFVRLRDREALRRILREAFQSLPARDLSLLRLHHLEGVSLEKLAELQETSRSSVARWLADARQAAFARVHELLRLRLKLSERERRSLIRFLGSRLDLSLTSALRTE